MADFYRFLIKYETWIYILLAIGGLISLRNLASALFARYKAYWGMEKEISDKRIRTALTSVFLLGLLGLAQFVFVSFAVVRLPGLMQVATPTIDPFAAPTLQLPEGLMDITPEALAQTQTAIAITGCIPEMLEWTFPKSGDSVSGSVELKGTVNVVNLGFYKYEYRQQGVEDWIPIAAGNVPVVDDLLGGNWNTEQLTPGNYELRLVVSDNQNKLLQPCVIQVKVLPI